jgi:pimeloyl-ACP methyl ester carboxylesterase
VNDVAALVRAVQRRPEIDKSALYAAGAAHGGCVSLQLAARATQLGLPPLRAVATLAAPTDFTALYAHAVEGSATDPALAELQTVLDAVGGPPSLDPTRYAARSVVEQAAALVATKTPVLLMHGTDDTVVPFSQACALHTKMRELGADALDLQLDAAGEVVTEPLTEPSCADVELAGVAPAAFDGPYYFMPLLGVGHSAAPEVYYATFVTALLEFSDAHPNAP